MPRPPHRRPQNTRRKPPEEATGAERIFLGARLKAGDRLTVEQRDGTRCSGVLRSFNDESIAIETDDHEELRLNKSQIRYIETVK